MTEQWVLRSEGYVQPFAGGAEGQYLEFYNPSADGPAGEEMGGWTPDLDKAMKFATPALAWQKWREPMVDKAGVPIPRQDGSGDLERPLTAFSVSVVTIEQARNEHGIDAGGRKMLRAMGVISDGKEYDDDDDEADSPEDRNPGLIAAYGTGSFD